MRCPYCTLDSAGKHEPNCPADPISLEKPPVYKQYGWLCPNCGRGNAPWVSTCSCVPQQHTTTWCLYDR